ncbi:MAG: hypothetical protein HDR90_01410 [Bacteroides sp.]|nr:hypothetical protein [Bacteroides sp.]
MSIRFPLYLIASVLITSAVAALSSCNTDSYYYTEASYTGAAVTSFSLKKNDSVLKNIDSVFFSIDLINGRIFNAEPLPKGTELNKLPVTVGTQNVSKVNLTYRIYGTDRDTTVNYLTSPNDSINFANGPVKLSVTSGDGLTTRDYTVKVNVYAVEPDTLFWAPRQMHTLPSSLAAIDAVKTVARGDETLCLTTSGTSACLATSTDLYDNVWTTADITLPAGAVVESFEASADALYILGGDGTLYSATSATTPQWTSTGVKMSYIYGIYESDSRVLGNIRNADGSYSLLTYPATTVTDVPAGMPVSGTSNMLSVDSRWSFSPISFMLGGRLASGECTGDTWGYDGSSWARISSRAVMPGEAIAICRYPTVDVNTKSWTFKVRDAILAIGGQDKAGNVDDIVSISYDEGISWADADTYMNLPATISGRGGAQLIVNSRKLDLATATDWSAIPLDKLTQLRPEDMQSRATAPITEWECPYIYMFGGHDSNGQLYNQVWRGVINRFTFVPVY